MSWMDFIRAIFRKQHKLAPLTWATAIFAVIYTVSPLDFDWIPIVGWIDDLGVWGVFIALAAREKSRYEVAVHGAEYVKATRLD